MWNKNNKILYGVIAILGCALGVLIYFTFNILTILNIFFLLILYLLFLIKIINTKTINLIS